MGYPRLPKAAKSLEMDDKKLGFGLFKDFNI